MKAVTFSKIGGPEVLELTESETTDPGEEDLLIRVTSAGLNRADTLFRQGRYLLRPHSPSRTGMETAGVVEAVGSAVTDFKPGDRVGTLPGALEVGKQGGFAEYVTVPARIALPTPESVDDRDAGGVWMQYLTAWGALNHAIQLKAGQTVVITAGSSSVGLAAVEVANHLGATPIVTTTHGAKIEKLKANGAEHVIDVRNEDYVKRVKEITGGGGVDVVFDPVAGPSVADHLRLCRQGGWIFIYGVLDTRPMEINPGHLLGKNINLRGYTIFPLLQDHKALAIATKTITDQINASRFKLNIDRRFALAEIAEAQRYMESNEQVGKIVINP